MINELKKQVEDLELLKKTPTLDNIFVLTFKNSNKSNINIDSI